MSAKAPAWSREFGKPIPLPDGRELLNVCKTIDALQRQPIKSHSYRRYWELYPLFAGPALGLAVLVALLELTRWRRIP